MMIKVLIAIKYSLMKQTFIRIGSVTPVKVILVILFLTGNLVRANEPARISLEDAIGQALEHNAVMKAARADLQIADRLIWETTAAGLPQISASLGYNYFLDIPTSLIPAEFFGGEPGEFQEIQFGTQHNITATASLEQLIFDGQYIVGLRAARIYRDLAGQTLKRSGIEITNAVRETYFLVLLAGENLRIVNDNLRNMEQTLYETQKLLAEGFTDPINADQLQLSVSNMKHHIAHLERQKKLTENLLKYQLGIDMDFNIELIDSLEGLFDKVLTDMAVVPSLEKDDHIDYRIARSQEAMSMMVLRREQSAYLPSLSASFVRQEMAMRDAFNFFDSDKSWFPATYFALNLNIPIFSSGMRSSQVQQARLELEKAQIAKEQLGRALTLQMEEAKADLDTAYEQYLNEKSSLEIAQRIFDRTGIMYREGMASSLELTQANDQLLATRANYLNAKFEVLNARNNIYKAIGR